MALSEEARWGLIAGGVIGAVIVIVVVLRLAGAIEPVERSSSSTTDSVSSCVDRGVAYFREIGSWPTLSDGRNAREVAAERCSRTTGAF